MSSSRGECPSGKLPRMLAVEAPDDSFRCVAHRVTSLGIRTFLPMMEETGVSSAMQAVWVLGFGPSKQAYVMQWA
jgi:hypothetical protein